MGCGMRIGVEVWGLIGSYKGFDPLWSITHWVGRLAMQRGLCRLARAIDRRVEGWIVVHLELAVEFEALMTGEDVGP